MSCGDMVLDHSLGVTFGMAIASSSHGATGTSCAALADSLRGYLRRIGCGRRLGEEIKNVVDVGYAKSGEVPLGNVSLTNLTQRRAITRDEKEKRNDQIGKGNIDIPTAWLQSGFEQL